MPHYNNEEIKKSILDTINSSEINDLHLYTICKKVFSNSNLDKYVNTLSDIYKVLDSLSKEQQITIDKDVMAYYTLNTFIQKTNNIQKDITYEW